ncbi:MAG: hypothetical protein JKY31_02375 [Rhodobacteraceae bacterium]|nr:hypothetical protein [Paracoccaceae bacterium]
MKNTVFTITRIGGGLSLLGLPAILGLAFLAHFASMSDFMNFQLAKPPYSADHLWETLMAPDGGFRFSTMPHYIGYFSLPLFIAVALILARAIYATQPVYALVGAVLTTVGTVFMAGVFGAWLAFSAIAQLGGGQFHCWKRADTCTH